MVSGKQYFTFLAGLKVHQGCVMQFNGICQTIFSILQSSHSLHYAMDGINSLESLLVLPVSPFQLDIISGLLWTVMITFPKLIKYILLGQLIESQGSTDGNRLVRRQNSEIRSGSWIPVASMIHIFLFGHGIILMVLEFFSDGFCSKKEEINSFRNFSVVGGDL